MALYVLKMRVNIRVRSAHKLLNLIKICELLGKDQMKHSIRVDLTQNHSNMKYTHNGVRLDINKLDHITIS